jgi:glycoside/pentoside/hexuronide:cation symporter, GPH family
MMTDRLTFREKAGYGLGDFASSMFWKLFSMYLLYFYTDVFVIPAAAVGTMFLITRLWDAGFDPVVGVLADRTSTRWGKFRPYLLWAALPFGIAGVLTFSSPSLSPVGRLVYAYVTYSLMMMVYSLVNVPYASLLGVMSADGRERTALSSYRMVFAFMGSILALALLNPLLRFFGGQSPSEEKLAWQLSVTVFSALAILLFWLTFSWTRERVRPIHEANNRLRADVRDLLMNKPWWILLGAGISALIFTSIRDGAAIYYFKYFIQDRTFLSLYFVLGQACGIAGIVMVTPLASRFGKRNTYLGSMLCATVLSVLFYWLRREDIVLILVFQCLVSLFSGAVFPLLWSMYADIADYSEWKTGRRATGLIFSSSSMSQKFGWTLGGALTGWLLGYYGFQANTVQSLDAQNGIKLMLSLFPAIGTVLAAAFVYLYPLDERLLKRIVTDLGEARNNAEAAYAPAVAE